MMKEPRKKVNLEDARATFWLLGLCVVLLGVYGLFNLKSYQSDRYTFPEAEKATDDAYSIPRTRRQPQEQNQQKKKIKKSHKFVIDDTFNTVDDKFLTTVTYEDTALAEIVDWGMDDDIEMEIDMQMLDKKPIFPGCEDVLDEQERFVCFQHKMIGFVQQNFKPCDEGFGTIKEKFYLKFTIDKDGRAKNAEVIRGENACNAEKATQLVSHLPQMKPGMYRDKQVKTTFVLPINIK